ncbi:SGNH/GDSL hydrolase family protein [Cribrihabitans pelagius]|uniref:SGNH/GDSL hydrolase family protein n=1 Tax=Cribrihabitans pelagius TaxID=1765746 RepID=UPI003B5B520F
MTVYISGGSNSVSDSGWVGQFRSLAGAENIENISIGAAPSHMSLFRVSQTVDLKAGDTVLWEYGINDAAHIEGRGYDAADLLEAIEGLIIYCADVGAKLCGLIFQPRYWEKQAERQQYMVALHSLFKRYGVAFFDVSQEFCAKKGHDHLPMPLYKNRAHYAKKPRFLQFIAKGAWKAVNASNVPIVPEEESDFGLRCYDQFSAGKVARFENKRVKVDAVSPPDEGTALQFDQSGRVLGLVIVSTPGGGAFNVSVGGRTYKISATYRERKFTKTMVKFVSLPTLFGEVIEFEPGDEIRISWADNARGMIADHRFRKKVSAKILAGREAAVVCVMTSERGKVGMVSELLLEAKAG